MAGLLTYSIFNCLPILKKGQWRKGVKYIKELTAAGTVPDFHRIPYYSFQNHYSDGKSNNIFVLPNIVF